jgi:flagella basal body P-ring formation protein FlgA
MKIRFSHAAIALAASAAPAFAQGFADPASIDQEVAVFLGVSPADAGKAFIPVDRRLKLTACAEPLAIDWPGSRRDSVVVQCPQAGGWKLYVRTIGQGSVQAAAAAPVIKRGDVVTVTVKARGFSVSQEGQAMEAGAVGDWIRIKVGKDKEMQAQVLRPGAAVMTMS